MKRKLLLVLAFIALPGFANSLGLGKLQLNSALNQPFDARIELLSANASELNSLIIGLADTEAFRRAKIDRPFVLSKLRFEVKEVENGTDYIQISSNDAIREPFLNFLLEANWSTGRMFREYTVLLDPPLYDPEFKRVTRSDSYTPSSSSSDSYIADDADDESSLYSTSSASPSINYSGGEYGPTADSDTLWSVAKQVRPDSSVSVQQMMMALLRANPDAFINDNINGLKRGHILNIPGRDEIDVLSTQDAVAEVRSQNASWQSERGIIFNVSDRPDSMDIGIDDTSGGSTDESASAGMIEDDESELRLVAASSDGAGIGQGGGNDSDIDLSLANEQLEAVSQENLELKDRMQETETIIDDLKRLISLKDDELAALQQQMAGGGVSEQVEPSEYIADSEDEVLEEEVFEEEAVYEDDEEVSSTDEAVIDEESEYEFAGEEEASDELSDELVSEDVLAEEMDEEVVVAEIDVAEGQVEDTVADSSPHPGMLDQVINFVMGNLTIILGALIGLIIAIVALLIISRRKQNAAEEPVAVATTDFPDFDDVEEEQPEIDADVSTDKGDEIGSEEGADEPVAEEPGGDSSGGIMDITAEDSETADAGVDFDIGGMEAPADESPDEVSLEVPADDNALEFDAGGMDAETESSDGDADLASGDDNIIDFDTGSDDEDLGIELDAGEDIASDDGGVELDLSMDDEDGESLEVPGEINIDELEASPDEGLEIDLSIDDDADSDDALDANNLELDTGDDDESDDNDDNDAIALDNDLDMDLDLEIQEDNADVPEIDMEGTVEMPKLDVGDMGIEIDDDDDHTVFVPRASAADEQTAEDEIATKLDLAKAYVELGDKDSAKGILDEVLADGNEEQKQAAQELISQLD